MSVNCNKSFKMSVESLRDKKRLSAGAGLALLGAASDVFKAMELADHQDGAAASAVYVGSAEAKLRNASGLMGEVVSLLDSGTFRTEMTSWYQNLDFDRLYRTGVAEGVLPLSADIWAEFSALLVKEGPYAVTDSFRARLGQTADLMADWLASAGDAGSETRVVRLAMAIADMSAFARFVGYVSDLEPLDGEWLRPATATSVA